MKKKNRIERICIWCVFLIASLLILYPFVFMLSGAFKTDIDFNRNILGLIPKEITLEHFDTLFKKIPFAKQLLNSFFVAGASAILGVLVNSMVAYGFVRFEFKGKKVLFSFILATMLVPVQVLLIPQFEMYKDMGLFGSFIPLIVPAMINAFGIYLICQIMGQVPKELFESAMIDGCGEWRIFATLAVPLSKTGIAIQAILTFMASWNDYLNPLIYLNEEEKYTLSIGLMKLKDFYSISYGSSLAGALLSCIPVIALLLVVGQKYFVKGLMAGAVKG